MSQRASISNRLSEDAIRCCLKKRAHRIVGEDDRVRVVEEVQVDGGRARIDMLFVGEFTVGIEIKSAQDSLSRLPTQSEAYSRYFDYLILATDEKFVRKALEILPEWWGVACVLHTGTRLALRQVRRAKPNPELNAEFCRFRTGRRRQ